ncbi:MAG: hypothetical protein LBC96_01230 [Lachnospiraceae bacterium]|jgi:hypothetical protein|nr:hypothetical protein [Lachnospiraceae bacterium]
MANIRISTMMLIFGLILIGCNNNSTNDSKLNGKWIDEVSGTYEMKFNNGIFETFDNGEPIFKGIYTAINGMYDAEITHFFGNRFCISFRLEPLLDKKWYSINELKNILSNNYFITDNEINEQFRFDQKSPPIKYSIVDNKLILSDGNGEGIYIKK